MHLKKYQQSLRKCKISNTGEAQNLEPKLFKQDDLTFLDKSTYSENTKNAST